MIKSELIANAFPLLKAQKFTLRRASLSAALMRPATQVSSFENQTAERLRQMFEQGATQYRHLIFDTNDVPYAWTGTCFVRALRIGDQLIFQDNWGHELPALSDVRTAEDLFCDHFGQFTQQLMPESAVKSLWTVGTEDELRLDDAVRAVLEKRHQMETQFLGIDVDLERYCEGRSVEVVKHLVAHSQYECSTILQHATIKLINNTQLH